MEHFMNLVLIKNIYIGIPMAALICYLFLLFCFLNVAEKSSEVRDLKAILSALLSWTGGAVLMRLQDTVLVSCVIDGTFYDPDTDI